MKIRYRAQALADLGAIHEFIAETNVAAAGRVIDRLHKSLNRLKIFPLSGRAGLVEGTRELIVSGLPYIIVYLPGDEFVDIVAVFHGARSR
ncbi:MAG: type II toxin-antitoxin system RelE/ParE family toxin [Chitinophagales bacterium]|nr:type II toxin-antitoxin system RelE/ParE family toxin [Hyphomicrobiales bacterium]